MNEVNKAYARFVHTVGHVKMNEVNKVDASVQDISTPSPSFM
jgi:hypothetical protein